MENNQAGSIPNLVGKKIIAVDDDRDILTAVEIILTGEGCEVVLLIDGRSILEDQPILPDLYLLDDSLPYITGLYICEFLKCQELTCKIPIIIMSANTKRKHAAMNAGAFAFIEKPFQMHEFIKVVCSAVN